MSRKQRKLARKPWITKGILTSIRKKIQCFELISLLIIQWKKTSFGVTRTSLQKLNPRLKRFTITLNSLATKKTCIKRGKLYVRYCRINQP